ncbi:MAG: acyltransferase, partial [Actinomycetes bacterium]
MRGGTKSARLPLVDSLRAVAALLIFGYHALFVTGHLSSTNYGYYLSVGVPLFYCISGLLLFRPFARSLIQGEERPSTRDYGRHRLFRIVPAYWLALPLVAVVLGRTAQVFTGGGVVTYFGFLQAYRLETFVGGIGQAWTLCVEVAFYVFLPFWAALLALIVSRVAATTKSRGRVVLAGLGLLILASVAWKVMVVSHYGGDRAGAIVPLTALPAALDQFAFGMLIAVLLVMREGGDRSSHLLALCLRRPWVPALAALVAYGLIGAVHGNSPFGSVGFGSQAWGLATVTDHELRALVAGGLVLAGVCAVPGIGLVGRTLGSGWLSRVGEVSYGLYLWHLAVLTVLAGNLHWALGEHGYLAEPGGEGVTGS